MTVRRIVVVAGVVALVAVGGFFATQGFGSQNAAASPTPTVTAKSSRLGESVVAEARVIPVQSATLAFQTPGVVAETRVALGDTVQAGQVLVRLASEKQAAGVAEAEAALKRAEAKVAELKAGSRQQEVEAAKAAVEAAQAKLALTSADGRTEDVAAAQAAVAGARAKYGQLSKSTTDADIRAAEQSVTSAQAQIQKAEADLKKLRDGATAEDIKNAELAIDQAKNSLWAAQTSRDGQCGGQGSPKFVCDSANSQVAAAETAVQVASNNLIKVKTPAKAEDVATAEQAVVSAQGQLVSAQARLRQVKQGATAEELAQAQSAITQAEQQVLLRQKPYTENDVAAAKADVRRAQAQLDLVSAGNRPEIIAAAEADVASAKAALERAKSSLADTELKAPFAGTIATLDLKKGENVLAGTAVIQIADLSTWELETTDLTELGIVNVREGSLVSATVDAIPDLKVPGKVTKIKALGERRQGDIVYTVTIKPDQHEPRLKWNMTASVTIEPGQQ